MAIITRPHKGLHNVIASLPNNWQLVTPHAANYLSGDANAHTVAVALKAATAGTVEFYDLEGGPKIMTFQAGETLGGEFTRVLAANTTVTELWAGFIEEA